MDVIVVDFEFNWGLGVAILNPRKSNWKNNLMLISFTNQNHMYLLYRLKESYVESYVLYIIVDGKIHDLYT